MNKMRPIHPGEILREEFLVPLGLSASALALELKVPAPRINDIARDARSRRIRRCDSRAISGPARSSGWTCRAPSI
jgi:hypothetical protein